MGAFLQRGAKNNVTLVMSCPQQFNTKATVTFHGKTPNQSEILTGPYCSIEPIDISGASQMFSKRVKESISIANKHIPWAIGVEAGNVAAEP
jgi:hypothetical protein